MPAYRESLNRVVTIWPRPASDVVGSLLRGSSLRLFVPIGVASSFRKLAWLKLTM